jgi:hypothetical protein
MLDEIINQKILKEYCLKNAGQNFINASLNTSKLDKYTETISILAIKMLTDLIRKEIKCHSKDGKPS